MTSAISTNAYDLLQGIDLKKEMEKRLENMEEQFRKEKEERKKEYEKERQVSLIMHLFPNSDINFVRVFSLKC